MRALVLPAYGPASTLTVGTLPDPTAGPGEIALRMAGASINPIDWKQMSGAAARWIPLELPAVLGRDVSGTVVAVGSGVKELVVGARVMGRVRGGAFAEIAVGPAAGFVAAPAGLDLADAAALPLVLLTGAQLAEEAIDARAGESVLVTGATGNVGRVAVFAAKGRGAKVWAGVREKYVAAARELGVAGVVILDDAAAVAALPELDAIADTVGGETGGRLVAKLKVGGRYGGVVGVPAAAEAAAKEKRIAAKSILTHDDGKRLAALAQAVADGALAIPIARRFPLAEGAAAMDFAQKGAEGKVLLLGL
jgi:NADPH:quinone reductase-like Zn-dependent oxidoreductase